MTAAPTFTDPEATGWGRVPGLPDDCFRHDGLITKHPFRAIALAGLRPRPGELLWDLGTGAGSIAVEWCRTDATCRAVGVERDADRLARARENASALTLPGQIEFAAGESAEIIASLPDPQAVFIGGGLTATLLAACAERLPSGGRLVCHGVTIEAETVLAEAHRERGGELMRVGVETADRIGRLRGWKPSRSVVAWTWSKP
ncbi:hypothetical protein GCM10009785_07410 [Brooklawnia cerclae]|uniref:Precorrin-6Y C5,15-methyltransferase (Decarboxylating) n=1 Tax=Brooklawnia cerclae TaxID=349934 RepID=A0ABX0SK59_9ACTN|nr:precorrin-6Y C5,15-methyltransferase (decarboxylating) subunit CbiT [Brooklawnia cerclae]NIH58319.1 precorrin-6Y C5,15-methyltransferase (decarboxylating) [Brooklawnia cerclae]